MLHSASNLGLHCLPVTLFGISRLDWVNQVSEHCQILPEYTYLDDDVHMQWINNVIEEELK